MVAERRLIRKIPAAMARSVRGSPRQPSLAEVLADVEENRPQAKKGQGMNKKQREWRLIAPFDDVVAANLFVGF